MAWCIRTLSAVQLAGKRDLQNNINQLTVCGMHALNVVAIIHLGVFDTENMAMAFAVLHHDGIIVLPQLFIEFEFHLFELQSVDSGFEESNLRIPYR